jgi:hypothetical protein
MVPTRLLDDTKVSAVLYLLIGNLQRPLQLLLAIYVRATATAASIGSKRIRYTYLPKLVARLQ